MSSRSVLVPGNASRYFSTKKEAASQPHGRLSLGLSEAGHLQNPLYAPELIRFDDNYLTTSCQAGGGELAADAQLSAARALALWWSTSHSMRHRLRTGRIRDRSPCARNRRARFRPGSPDTDRLASSRVLAT